MENPNQYPEDRSKDRMLKWICRALIVGGFLFMVWPNQKKDEDKKDTTTSTTKEEPEYVYSIPEQVESNHNNNTNEWEVSEPDGFINGHGYVDLGLPSGLKWATRNVGASKAEDYGDYFAWGETKPKKTYTQANCSTYGKDSLWLVENRYVTKDGTLTLEHDAARQYWGGSWRMPTQEEIKELLIHTYPYWVTDNEIKGLLLENKDGKNIFFAAQGNMYESSLSSNGKHGYYWTSNVDFSTTGGLSYYFYFIKTGYYIFGMTRDNGFAIRPVSD